MYSPYNNPYADLAALQQQLQSIQNSQNATQSDPARQALENEYLKTEEGSRLHAALHEGFNAWRARKQGLSAPIDYGQKIADQESHIQKLEAEIKELKDLILK